MALLKRTKKETLNWVSYQYYDRMWSVITILSCSSEKHVTMAQKWDILTTKI
jgi:hypothetical protein